MKLLLLTFLLPVYLWTGFPNQALNSNPKELKWYLCSNCCKTKKASDAPWENGCRQSSSGMHNYQFCGKAGDYNYTCRKCDAEVYLGGSQSPAASKCCASGGTHSWYNR
ncbi:MAG: hypothetical protein ACK5B6_07555 [Bacteroidia bacterium]|jgi:hypothetical protein